MRWPLAGLLLAALGLAGCGTIAVSANPNVPGSHANVYTSLPLEGFEGVAARQIARGEQLALAQAHGRAGKLDLSLVLLNDANPQTGSWEPGLAATNARLAAEDNDAIAYIGELNSGATAVSLPLTNGGSLLQISPASPYVGLTSSLDAGQDDPARFYPTGRQTFLRLAPGDSVEAAADLAFLEQQGVQTIYLISDENPFYTSLAQLLQEDGSRAGLAVVGSDRIHLGAADEPNEYKGEAEKVARAGAQAVFFAGPAEGGAVALFRELAQVDPGLLLLGDHPLANGRFTARLGPAAGNVYLSSPWLAPSAYPPRARAVLAAYAETFHETPQVYALYGYEAMALVIAAVKAAGAHARERGAVVSALFRLARRDGVLGPYRITASGETTLSAYEIYRVVQGLPEPFRLIKEEGGTEVVRPSHRPRIPIGR